MLGDARGGGTEAPDGEADEGGAQEASREVLDLTREGGAEHQRAALLREGHVGVHHEGAHLGLEPHVEHAVGLVEDEETDGVEGEGGAVVVVEQAAGGGDEEVGAAAEGTELVVDVGAAVGDGDLEGGAEAELAGLHVDLDDKLPCGGEDDAVGSHNVDLGGGGGGGWDGGRRVPLGTGTKQRRDGG